jgi:hypothetical protein
MGANIVIGKPMGTVSFITMPLEVRTVVSSFNEYAFKVT